MQLILSLEAFDTVAGSVSYSFWGDSGTSSFKAIVASGRLFVAGYSSSSSFISTTSVTHYNLGIIIFY